MKILLTTIFILASQTAILCAQLPPMLPGNPSQAPIDGGLSLVALAGGAYAYRKLRHKKA
jgi:hypothetical protein